jgi:hypothetical protein
MLCPPELWTNLEAHGLTQAHLEALLRFLRCQQNGSFAWHGRQGQLEHCEVRVVFPGRAPTLRKVSDEMLVE